MSGYDQTISFQTQRLRDFMVMVMLLACARIGVV